MSAQLFGLKCGSWGENLIVETEQGKFHPLDLMFDTHGLKATKTLECS